MTKETQFWSLARRFWRDISLFLPISPTFCPPQKWSLRKHSLGRIYLGGCLESSIPGFPSVHQMTDWSNERTMKKNKNVQKKRCDMMKLVGEKKKDQREDRKKKLSPEHHLHILHIHSHFYRSVFHRGCLYRRMRIHVYLGRFGYRDPHRMRIYAFYKGAGVIGKAM